MKQKQRSNKEIILLILFIAVVCLGVLNFSTVIGLITNFLGMIKPFVIGLAMAFVINLPMKFIEEKMLKGIPEKRQSIKRTLGILLSFLLFAAVITFVVVSVIPQLGRTITQLTGKIPKFFNTLFYEAEILLADNPEALEFINDLEYQSMNWNNILNQAVGFVKNGVGSLLTSTVTVAGSLFGSLVNGIIAFIFSIYVLSQKEKLKEQSERIIRAYFKENTQKKIMYVSQLLYRNFSKFITGQCVEAVILGCLFVVTMSIFQMPYAFMIGVLIAFTALIPLVGAFIGCFVGAFLILVDTPIKALWFVVLFLVIQQVEGNLIYPKVVGNSVGLPSLWVLVAVALGSSMFGVPGMLMFIPLFSTAYTLIREDVNKRNAEKEMEKSKVTIQEKKINEIQKES
ncbi:MAG: AI-2E family transporter [Lachnospiraceae bacterium]|nr:AI-2E family transporter [Lachnospiraceae bacterium]